MNMLSQYRILLVEDEEGLVLTLTDRLEAEGYRVQHAGDGLDGYQMALKEGFDLILLDLMLPGRSGVDVCRDLRREGIATPIIMLTAKGDLTDKVIGLKIGADDYVVKPFETLELLARIEAVLRRAPAVGNSTDLLEVYRFGDITIDFKRMEVLRGSKPVELSSKLFQLLRFFIQNRGEVLTRNQLLDEVWGYESMPTTRTVDVHLAWLRQKLEIDPAKPQYFTTVYGAGYKFKG